MIKLNPCPICGSRNVSFIRPFSECRFLHDLPDHESLPSIIAVRCLNCGLMSNPVTSHCDADGISCPISDPRNQDRLEELAEAWNDRKSETSRNSLYYEILGSSKDLLEICRTYTNRIGSKIDCLELDRLEKLLNIAQNAIESHEKGTESESDTEQTSDDLIPIPVQTCSTEQGASERSSNFEGTESESDTEQTTDDPSPAHTRSTEQGAPERISDFVRRLDSDFFRMLSTTTISHSQERPAPIEDRSAADLYSYLSSLTAGPVNNIQEPHQDPPEQTSQGASIGQPLPAFINGNPISVTIPEPPPSDLCVPSITIDRTIYGTYSSPTPN